MHLTVVIILPLSGVARLIKITVSQRQVLVLAAHASSLSPFTSLVQALRVGVNRCVADVRPLCLVKLIQILYIFFGPMVLYQSAFIH